MQPERVTFLTTQAQNDVVESAPRSDVPQIEG